jgi:hypothetical protein
MAQLLRTAVYTDVVPSRLTEQRPQWSSRSPRNFLQAQRLPCRPGGDASTAARRPDGGWDNRQKIAGFVAAHDAIHGNGANAFAQTVGYRRPAASSRWRG